MTLLAHLLLNVCIAFVCFVIGYIRGMQRVHRDAAERKRLVIPTRNSVWERQLDGSRWMFDGYAYGASEAQRAGFRWRRVASDAGISRLTTVMFTSDASGMSLISATPEPKESPCAP